MKFLIGPEIIWALIYGLVVLLAKSNQPPSAAIDKILENLFLYTLGVLVCPVQCE